MVYVSKIFIITWNAKKLENFLMIYCEHQKAEMQSIVIILSMYILSTCVDGFAINSPAARIIMNGNRGGASRACRQRNFENELEKQKKMEKQKKCDYANLQFPMPKKSCSAPPPYTFRDVYEKSYKMQVWEFQQQECVKPEFNSRWFLIFCLCLGFGIFEWYRVVSNEKKRGH